MVAAQRARRDDKPADFMRGFLDETGDAGIRAWRCLVDRGFDARALGAIDDAGKELVAPAPALGSWRG